MDTVSGGSTAPHSIWPANWRLPVGGYGVGIISNEFDILNARLAGFASNQDMAYHDEAINYLAGWTMLVFSKQSTAVIGGEILQIKDSPATLG